MEKTYCNVMDTIGLTDRKKAEMIRNCAEKVRIRSVPRRLVKVAIALCVTVVLACTTVAAVNEQKRTTWKDVYDSYEQVVEEVGEKYGLELFMVAAENSRLTIPVEEFRNMVERHCADIQKKIQQNASEAENVNSAFCTIIQPYGIDAIFITFHGAFDICENADKSYTATPKSISVMTRGGKGILAYEILGEVEMEEPETGRYVAKQKFRVLNSGAFEKTIILRIEFRIDPLTGEIYALEWGE